MGGGQGQSALGAGVSGRPSPSRPTPVTEPPDPVTEPPTPVTEPPDPRHRAAPPGVSTARVRASRTALDRVSTS